MIELVIKFVGEFCWPVQ